MLFAWNLPLNWFCSVPQTGLEQMAGERTFATHKPPIHLNSTVATRRSATRCFLRWSLCVCRCVCFPSHTGLMVCDARQMMIVRLPSLTLAMGCWRWRINHRPHQQVYVEVLCCVLPKLPFVLPTFKWPPHVYDRWICRLYWDQSWWFRIVGKFHLTLVSYVYTSIGICNVCGMNFNQSNQAMPLKWAS